MDGCLIIMIITTKRCLVSNQHNYYGGYIDHILIITSIKKTKGAFFTLIQTKSLVISYDKNNNVY